MAESMPDSLNDASFSFQPDLRIPRNARQKRYFSVSVASSANSSRTSSPASVTREKLPYAGNGEDVDSSGHPIDVYDATLSWWRAAIRRRLVKSVKWESTVIARMQVSQLFVICIFSPWLCDSLYIKAANKPLIWLPIPPPLV